MSFLASYLLGVVLLAALFALSMRSPRLGLFLLAAFLIAAVAVTQHEKKPPTKTTCLYCT